MNRNTEQYFATNPQVNIGRSKFGINYDVKLTGNVGRLIPYDVIEVLPGDTHKIKTSKVIRLTTPVTPFMDNLFADFYSFFVPMRLTWEHAQNFFGESDAAWTPETTYEIPQIYAPQPTDDDLIGGWHPGTIADYMGIPTKVTTMIDQYDNLPLWSVSALPFRAFAKIYEDWFRSTVLQDPLNIPMGETMVEGSNGDNYINDLALGGMCPLVNKTFDYFTGALPAPQRGEDVKLSTILREATIPVFGTGKSLGLTDNTNYMSIHKSFNSAGDLNITALRDGNQFGSNVGTISTGGNGNNYESLGVPTREQLNNISGATYDETGLEAYISPYNFQPISINTLRTAFQVQKWFEKLARGGDRYISIIKSFFGVTSPDARLQRSEYLGGSRVPINVSQVVNSNGWQEAEDPKSKNGNAGVPFGATGAMSLTVDSHYDFEKSFVEHGYIINCVVLRYDHTYQQGLNKMWSRKTKFDFYWPTFANIGEQAILNQELEVRNNSENDAVFGYQEAWADYRYKPNRVAGMFRSNTNSGMDSWHLADNYLGSRPYLSADWLAETPWNVDRVLTVGHEVADQFFMDIYVEDTAIRPMPVNSIPGLIDHH